MKAREKDIDFSLSSLLGDGLEDSQRKAELEKELELGGIPTQPLSIWGCLSSLCLCRGGRWETKD